MHPPSPYPVIAAFRPRHLRLPQTSTPALAIQAAAGGSPDPNPNPAEPQQRKSTPVRLPDATLACHDASRSPPLCRTRPTATGVLRGAAIRCIRGLPASLCRPPGTEAGLHSVGIVGVGLMPSVGHAHLLTRSAQPHEGQQTPEAKDDPSTARVRSSASPRFSPGPDTRHPSPPRWAAMWGPRSRPRHPPRPLSSRPITPLPDPGRRPLHHLSAVQAPHPARRSRRPSPLLILLLPIRFVMSHLPPPHRRAGKGIMSTPWTSFGWDPSPPQVTGPISWWAGGPSRKLGTPSRFSTTPSLRKLSCPPRRL